MAINRFTHQAHNVHYETEPPYSSPLNNENRSGVFCCSSCQAKLFYSTAKYNSNSGWPSFWSSINGAIGELQDNSYNTMRTEVHCIRCNKHLGHVFNDGPAPTSLRYCINGSALIFKENTA